MEIKTLITLGVYHSVYWSVTQLSLSHLFTKVPRSFFVTHHQWFQTFSFEKEGELWNRLFLINKWKMYIPEGEWLNKNIYNKRVLKPLTQESVYKMIIEMRRAELVHWLSILPVIVFVKAPKCIKTINILYALLANVPIILTQRYNRPRLERYYQLKYKRGMDDGE
ncbi:glycosyl-4,4'-diaponeurosporenoate acyltransferase [Staphylococcus hominis subsp. hominis]|uniref:glycosyl-4,4'-diaponeurosporenoate acyltransferase CrtO family protein n=1 Tax=Staphylococcus hominis TaxID=1290 RepID=UPI000B3B4300|nr:glycosyl-4,4'-diaponeurosporenoate acyltransferase [Staphylococcus hominis]AUJ51480.1 glycosyl-4,4'-diaponeurosporenoate acyltransferase [Staphylococcus hominis subsp. hominis]OUL46959.1 glycosyl-4,4'-diaponeurosporenoate acyltransferase [Staphylococcus hominis subsp. hominis]